MSIKLTHIVDSESWSIAAIDAAGLKETINEYEEVYPEWAIYHCLKNMSISENMGTFELCPKRLSIQLALFILKQNAEDPTTTQSIILTDFMEAWTVMLPSEVKPELNDLFGFAYLSSDSSRGKSTEVITYLNPLNLPREPLNLFNYLFSLKKQVRH